MARPGLLVFENVLRSRGSGSQPPFSCHLPLIVLMMMTVITILEHVSCAWNFNLNNNSATLASFQVSFASKETGWEAR